MYVVWAGKMNDAKLDAVKSATVRPNRSWPALLVAFYFNYVAVAKSGTLQVIDSTALI